VPKRLANRLNHKLQSSFPEQRLFLRSEDGTRFIILSPVTQLFGWLGSAAFVAWAIIATAILLMDSIGSGNLRDQAAREAKLYEERLQNLADERDSRAEEAAAAQMRFASAMEQISKMQSELLASEDQRHELETGINVIQSTLRRTMKERDASRNQLASLLNGNDGADGDRPALSPEEAETVSFLTAALNDISAERDTALASAAQAETYANELLYDQHLRDERNDQIFRQLEDAVTISLEPLDKMFQAAGMSTDNILDTVRRGYSGQGGPLTPLVMSTMGAEPDADAARANEILDQLDRMNLYRIAASKLPFGMPVKSSFRYSSPYGMRWGRMHEGIDMAGPRGTPIYASADGVVKRAGWVSGYGRFVEIQHDFGITTRYGHMSALHVTKGQRVSLGDRIGDMGSTGHSTGNHLHYEIRVGGKPINPMIYIKAAKNVF
jgi:murein DD-endopeptidase MepM/ murein hydrolase activator NlpD